MAIQLIKDKPLNFSKVSNNLDNIRIGLSWDSFVIKGKESDADVSVFMLNEESKLPNDNYLVCFSNLRSEDGSVYHGGDARTGAADGDDESINISLSRVSPLIHHIVVTVTIDNSDLGFNFGNTKNLTIKLYDQRSNQVICQFKLDDEYPYDDSVVIATISRTNNGDWEIEAKTNTFSGGLIACYNLYSLIPYGK